MKYTELKVLEDDKYYNKTYSLNKTIQIDTLFEVINFFKGDEYEFRSCNCMSYDENGGSIYFEYDNVDDIRKIVKLPSPYVSFSIDFCDKQLKNYKFSLTTAINSNYVHYIINKKIYNDENGYIDSNHVHFLGH